jgi:hypothetical protein
MKKIHLAGIMAVICLYFMWSFSVLKKHQVPPVHDAAICFVTAAGFAAHLPDLPRLLLENQNFYPPLYMLAAVPFFKLFAARPEILALVNIVYFAMLVFSLYLINQALNRSGMLAAGILLGMPVIIGYYRVTHLTAAVAACVALWAYLLMKTDYFRDRRYALACGCVAGIGMLEGFYFAGYAAGMILVYAGEAFFSDRLPGKKERFRNLLIGAAVALAVMSIWYVPAWMRGNFRDIFQFQFKPRYQIQSVYSFLALAWSYARYFSSVLLAPVFAVFFVSAVILHRRRLTGGFIAVCMWGWLFFSLFILMALGLPPDTRYLLPGIPAMGIVIAFTAQEVFRGVPVSGRIAAGLVWICCLALSFGLQYAPPANSREMMDSLLTRGILTPQRSDDRILELAGLLKEKTGGRPVTVVVITENDTDPAPLALDCLYARLSRPDVNAETVSAIGVCLKSAAAGREAYAGRMFNKARFVVFIKSRIPRDTMRPEYSPGINRLFKTLFQEAQVKPLRVFVDPQGFFTDDLYFYEKEAVEPGGSG